MSSFKYAFKGVYRLFRNEPHAQFHLFATVAVIAAGSFLRISAWEWCTVIICIGSVTAAEAFNTALETLANRVTREQDELIGAAKDLAAGAVLLTSVASAAVGLIIFLPKIIGLFQ